MKDGLWLRLWEGVEGAGEGEWSSVPMAPGQVLRHSLQEPEHRQIWWNFSGHKELDLPL